MAGKVYEIAFSLAGKVSSSFAAAFRTAGSSITGLSAGERRLASETAKATAAQDRQTAAMLKSSEAMAKAAAAQARMQKLRRNAQSLAGTGAVAGGSLLAGAASMTTTGMDFEAQMSKVKAVSQASSEDMARLTAQARRLGATTSWSATEAAQGMEMLAMAGFKTDKVMAAMPGMLNLATAAGAGLGETADIASNILSAFGMEAKEMGRVSDVLTAAFTNSNSTLQSLGESMKYCGPVAKLFGYSLEETVSSVAALHNVGIKASEAGTAMRGMMTSLGKPTSEAAKAFKDLGVSIKDKATGELKKFPVLFKEALMSMHRHGLTKAQMGKLFKMMFGQEAMAAAAAISDAAMKGAGEEGSLIDLFDKVSNSGGITDKTALTMADNMRGDLKALGSAFEELQLKIFDASGGAMRGFIQQATAITQAVGGWMERNPKLVTMIMEFGSALGVITAGVIAFNIALSLNPIALWAGAIAALVAAVVVLWKHWDEVWTLIQAKASEVIASLNATWEGFKTTMSGMWEGVKAAACGAWESIKSKAMAVLQPIIDLVNKIGAAFNTVIGGVGGAVKNYSANASISLEAPEQEFATGGIVTRATRALVGEAGPEAVIPLDRLSSVLGSASSGVGGVNVSFSPTINLSGVTGSEDPYDAVRRGLSAGADDLKRGLMQVLADQRRLSYA